MITYPRYIVQHANPGRSQRRASEAAQLDKTSSSHSKKAGRKMRAKVFHNYPKIVAYNEGINELLRRAGIISRL